MTEDPASVDWPAELMMHAQQRLRHEQTIRREACKVCGADAELFDVLDFARTCDAQPGAPPASGIPVYYRRCTRCRFIGTNFFDGLTRRQWTSWVYNDAYYSSIDPGYREIRPRANAGVVDAMLNDHTSDWRGLDYGGGNGETARYLQAMGYDYACHDPFGRSTALESSRGSYNFCSAFEVAEHTPDPRAFIADVVHWCTPGRLAVLIGTHVHDDAVSDAGRLAWWYAAPRNGHVSLHSRQSLQLLAAQQGLDCLSLSERTHLLTRGYSPSEARWFLLKGKCAAGSDACCDGRSPHERQLRRRWRTRFETPLCLPSASLAIRCCATPTVAHSAKRSSLRARLHQSRA